jgi:UDP:flavonoid glycosyltransferase YjiC (YdhE family)
MRVLIASAGGRGDVAPFTGLAAAIRAAGHSVTITSNDEYESLVVGCGLEFRPLPGTHGMFDDPRWIQDLGGHASAAKLIRLLAEHVRTLNKAILAVARQDTPDVLALSGIATVAGYHVAEGLGLHGMDLLLQPGHTTADFPPSFVSGGRSFGRIGNRAAGMAMTTGLALAMAGPAREIRRELGLPRRGIREALTGEPDGSPWPVFYGFSPAVVPRPADWPDTCRVTGYWWPRRPAGWRPPAELEEFLASGPPPVFFGFGDMTPDDPGQFIELATAAGCQAGVRQVIQAEQTDPASAGRPDDSIVIGDVPHDWLFPKMAAVVHHAGAGTAAAGLRAGVPTVTVPVLADQPFYAARLAALGVGPLPIPRRRLTVAALAAAIRDAVARPSYQTRAGALSRRLASEDGAAPVISMLARLGDR